MTVALRKKQLSKPLEEAVDCLSKLVVWGWGESNQQDSFCLVIIIPETDADQQDPGFYRSQVILAIKKLISRHPPTPSTIRWTSLLPAMAYVLLWRVLGDLGKHSINKAYRNHTAVSGSNANQKLPSAEDIDNKSPSDYALLFGARLRRMMKYHFQEDLQSKQSQIPST